MESGFRRQFAGKVQRKEWVELVRLVGFLELVAN